MNLRIVAPASIGVHLDCRGWSIGYIAVRNAITVIHGTDKLARAALFALALAVLGVRDAIAGLRRRAGAFLEKFLLFTRLILVLLVLPMRRRLGRLRLRRLRSLLWLLYLRLRALLCILLARSILAAPAPAAMPWSWRLRRLTVVRRGPHFRLGLRCFCRHACTS